MTGGHQLGRMRSMRIGVRLTFCFATILLLMSIGTVLSLWQFDTYHRHFLELDELDRQVEAVLRVNNDVLAYQQTLQNAAASQNGEEFGAAIRPFRSVLVRDLDLAREALRPSQETARQHAMTIAVL